MFAVTLRTVVLCFRHGNGFFLILAYKGQKMCLCQGMIAVCYERAPSLRQCRFHIHLYFNREKNQIVFLPVSGLFLRSLIMHVLWP